MNEISEQSFDDQIGGSEKLKYSE